MELDSTDVGRLDELGIVPLAKVVELQRLAEGLAVSPDVGPFLGEDQAMIGVRAPILELDFRLRSFVPSQERHSLRIDLNRADGTVGLRRAPLRLGAGLA